MERRPSCGARKYTIGFLVGLVVGALGVWMFHSTIDEKLNSGRAIVGKSMKRAGHGLEAAGEAVTPEAR